MRALRDRPSLTLHVKGGICCIDEPHVDYGAFALRGETQEAFTI